MARRNLYWLDMLSRNGRVLYRDPHYVVFQQGGFYVLHHFLTRRDRFYARLGDVFQAMRRRERPGVVVA